MKNSNRSIMTGIGIGAGLLGLAGAGAGLALAYRKAKKQDKTIKELISSKIKSKKRHSCCNCNINDDTSDLNIEETVEEIVNIEDDEDLFELLDEEDSEFDRLTEERDHYKALYEELISKISIDEKDKNKDR